MIDFLLLLLFIACLGMVAAWLAENPGHATIYWFDYRIDTSFAFLLSASLAAAFALAIAILLVRRLILAPGRYKERRNLKHFHKGLSQLTHSVAALAASDLKGAEAHTKKAEKLLGRTPLVLLLSAQVARSRGDEPATRHLLNQMLEHEETEYLAARSLSDAASKQQHWPQALELAERAHEVGPGGTMSAAAVVGLKAKLGQWQEALVAIRQAARRGHVLRSLSHRWRGIVYLEQGMQALAGGRNETALIAAKRALKDLPDFAPAVAFAAKAYAANDKERKAVKLLLTAWKKSPRTLLADTLRSIIAHEPQEKRQKILQKLGTGAPMDAAWICSACGHETTAWAAHCAGCTAFDTLEWKKRELKFAA